jgi:hypothetical protein
MHVTHSARLRSKIRLARSCLDHAAEKLWTHPSLKDLYPEFLFHNHAVIRASVPLMRTASGRCRTHFAHDPIAAGLVAYLQQHIPEELHHDEWVLDDLQALNIGREKVLARIPPLAASALVGPQYYWILHVHPIALLGFIAVMEGTPPDASYFGSVLARAGISEAAASNIFRHAKLDPRHCEDLDMVLDSLPLTDYHHSLMGISAFQTIDGLTRVAEGLYEKMG